MPEAAITVRSLKPYLVRCGYSTDSHLAQDYRFGESVVPLAGFSGRPWDMRSACLAVVETDGQSKAALAKCTGLGAPTAFVCRRDALEWWRLSPAGPTDFRTVSRKHLAAFFEDHKQELSPESIYGAKLRRPSAHDRQMWFVDVGLMPATERRAGETLHRLVEGVIQDLSTRLGGQLRSRKNFADLYKTVFWLLAAKLLHEKGVENFKRIDLRDVDEVFRRVGRHYKDTEDLPPGGRAWRPAIDKAAEAVSSWGYLGNVSSEAIAYLYETALIDKKPTKAAGKKIAASGRRKELGIHSTPPVLVDHMLAQVWPLIEEHPPDRRYVFEPACGHAGFLVAAMRWLRDFSGMDDGPARHRYLRDHLHGIELDPFAAELAKLSLTLADVPYGNSWRVYPGDMFEPGILRAATSRCTLLLTNPPYEPFTPAQRSAYAQAGEPVTALTKAVETLKRCLPNLPPGAVFGVVTPQGFLHDRESKTIREFLLAECELTEIAVFADNLFEQADHEVAVLLGRRRWRGAKPGKLIYRRVRENGMEDFKERLAFSSERVISQHSLAKSPDLSFLIPDLPEVWDYLAGVSRLGKAIEVQQGFQFLNKSKLGGRTVALKSFRPGWMKAVLRADEEYSIWRGPTTIWIDADAKNFRRPGAASKLGVPQVILNYAPVSRGPWRLKAVIDPEGMAVSSRFVTFRPKLGGPSLSALWAILNSPVANAYAYCFSGKRETLVKEWRAFPLPDMSIERKQAIESAADRYLALAKQADEVFMQPRDEAGLRAALLAMDAEVLRLYDLPPRLERQLLDLFKGVPRKGVGVEFTGYYPPGLDAFVPLHELISQEYARSQLGRFRQHHRPVQDSEILASLRVATDAFAED